MTSGLVAYVRSAIGSKSRSKVTPIHAPEEAALIGVFLVAPDHQVLCGGFSTKPSTDSAGLTLRDYLGCDLGQIKQVEGALTHCFHAARAGWPPGPQQLRVVVSGRVLIFLLSPLQLGEHFFCNLVVTQAAGTLREPGARAAPPRVSSDLSDDLSSWNLSPSQNSGIAGDDDGAFLRDMDSLIYSSCGKDSLPGEGALNSDCGEATRPSCKRCTQMDILQVTVGAQTDLSMSIACNAKAELPPSGIRAEDAARAAAMKLKAESSATKPRGLEGMWTILGDHESRVGPPMLRLTFSRGSCLDNAGFKHFVVKKGQWASVGRHCLSMEGLNILHLDPPSGARVTYTRGEGGYEVGRPLVPGMLKLDYLAPVKLAFSTAETLTRGAADFSESSSEECIEAQEDILLQAAPPLRASRSTAVYFSDHDLRALMQGESED